MLSNSSKIDKTAISLFLYTQKYAFFTFLEGKMLFKYTPKCTKLFRLIYYYGVYPRPTNKSMSSPRGMQYA